MQCLLRRGLLMAKVIFAIAACSAAFCGTSQPGSIGGSSINSNDVNKQTSTRYPGIAPPAKGTLGMPSSTIIEIVT